MLWSALDRELGQIASTADETSGGRPACCPESEQGLKGGHRRLASVMAKDEFVEIDLQVMPADAVIGADEPLLQVTEEGLKGGHRRLASVMAKDEFVEIDLQVMPRGLGTGRGPTPGSLIRGARDLPQFPIKS